MRRAVQLHSKHVCCPQSNTRRDHWNPELLFFLQIFMYSDQITTRDLVLSVLPEQQVSPAETSQPTRGSCEASFSTFRGMEPTEPGLQGAVVASLPLRIPGSYRCRVEIGPIRRIVFPSTQSWTTWFHVKSTKTFPKFLNESVGGSLHF